MRTSGRPAEASFPPRESPQNVRALPGASLREVRTQTPSPKTCFHSMIYTRGVRPKRLERGIPSAPAIPSMAPRLSLPPMGGVSKSTAKQQMLRKLVCSDAPEQSLRQHGFHTIAGVDEVGRGALFGPVVAAAVILPPNPTILGRLGLTDSKQLTCRQREELDGKIREVAVDLAIAEVDAETIDQINIYQASRLAMLRAVQQLTAAPDHLLIDALHLDLAQLTHPCAQTSLVYGDALSFSIAAASVIAKVHRDALMRSLDTLHPQYGLASHKGYATSKHRRALLEYGPTPLHRKSFAPVLAATCAATSAARPAAGPKAALDLKASSGSLFDQAEADSTLPLQGAKAAKRGSPRLNPAATHHRGAAGEKEATTWD